MCGLVVRVRESRDEDGIHCTLARPSLPSWLRPLEHLLYSRRNAYDDSTVWLLTMHSSHLHIFRRGRPLKFDIKTQSFPIYE